MEGLIGKWGGTDFHIILQYEERTEIHPDDWLVLLNYPYKHCIHLCIGYNDNFLILQFGNCRIRVLPNHFSPLNIAPKYEPLEHVKFLNSKKIIEFGMIKGIHWHNNQQKFYYDIEVNNKVKSRRYYDVDLEKFL